jgi:isoleucyl-tRNA synthetase
LVNRIQNLRKELNFDVTDRITVVLQDDNLITAAVMENKAYICAEILADELTFTGRPMNGNTIVIEETELQILIAKK